DVRTVEAQADQERLGEFRRAMSSMETSAAQGFLSVLSGHRSFASEMSSIASSLTQNLIAAGIARMNQQESEKLSDAKAAATHTYAEVSGWPVVGPFLAPELAAAAFAATMAFNSGGIVPGVERGD